MNNTILIIGSQGQVAWELRRILSSLGDVVHASPQTDITIDLTSPDRYRQTILDLKPKWIVNAAAYTAVDKAEQETETANTINAEAPGILAEIAKNIGAKLVHYSTDYVFDGQASHPYKESDATNPQGVYGSSKLAGERAIQQVGGDYLIFRTAWVYGLRGQNFMRTIRRLAREREELKIVTDQKGAPTWSRHIAEATAQVLAQLPHDDDWREAAGIYHMTSAGVATWYDFADAIVSHQRLHEEVACQRLSPITTAEYPTPAKRPAWSVLDTTKLANRFGVRIPDWRFALAQVQEEIPLYKSV
jgi:dTDP-4-dehydrorhamnose reductase